MLYIEGAQKFQRTVLRLNDAKNVNIDNSNSNVYFRNDGSIFESNEKHYFFDFLRIFVANSEIEYDFWNFLLADFNIDKWHLSKCFVFRKKIKNFIFYFFLFSIVLFLSIVLGAG